MKKFILFLLIAVVFTACGNKPKMLDPDAVLSIRPAAGVQLRSADTVHLTALEIVQQCNNMAFIFNETGKPSSRGFADAQRDLNPDAPRLKMWGSDIIYSENKLGETFIKAKDVVLEIHYGLIDGSDRRDTIAYIPNKMLTDAYAIIKPAFDSGDYETVYRVFDEAYRFIPITGAEYAELREQGIN